ncbi:MAG: addiction module protein [Verrucomicrobia bacterium]|nr:addiction module protein [Verrucomicrobiota bacterium]
MSQSERLQAMELLWKSLSHPASELPSPPWHGRILSQRLAKAEAGSARFLTVLELKNHLKR